MPETVVIDELHLTVRVPADLPEDQSEIVRRTLHGEEFMARLRRAVRRAFRAHPELAVVTVALTR